MLIKIVAFHFLRCSSGTVIHIDFKRALTTSRRFSAIGTTVRQNRQQTTRKTAPIALDLFLPL
ncbi:hypothetical protein DPD44_20325 [Salmonella enterica subsp. enterica serovar Poona]|nr:hypothetical protein [Salmonella enterica subsp. enterica serovar Poona]